MKKDTLYGLALLAGLWWYTRKTPAQPSVKPKKRKRDYTTEELDDLRRYPEPWKLNPGNFWTDAAGNIVPARIVALRG